MQFDYKVLEKKLGMENYNPDLKGQLIGIAAQYDKIVSRNNEKIFTGKLLHGGREVKYPKTLQERLKAQRFATAAKIKIIERYKDIYSPEDIISAIKGFKP